MGAPCRVGRVQPDRFGLSGKRALPGGATIAFLCILTVVLRVYVRLLPGIPHIPLLYPNLGRGPRGNLLCLEKAFEGLDEPFVALVDDLSQADYLLIPHNFPSVRDRTEYLHTYVDLSRHHRKPILVFAHGDSDAPIPLPNARVFRTSQYGYKKCGNEVMMPAYTEDLLVGGEPKVRERGKIPVVGFCGWADYKNLRNRIGTYVQNTVLDLQCIGAGSRSGAVRKKGLTLRRRAIRVLAQSPLIRTNFVIRSSHSAHAKTIAMDPVQARREYIENLLQSDLVLTIKGDGNYSLRFYEALSLGRVPLFLDTDCVLPLASVIPYDDFIIRIPFDALDHIDRATAERWQAIDGPTFLRMQHTAREMFTKYLSVKSFLRYAVEHLL